MEAKRELSTMAIITSIAAMLSFLTLQACFLTIIIGFVSLDEIKKYHYKGKILVISSMVLSAFLLIIHFSGGWDMVKNMGEFFNK